MTNKQEMIDTIYKKIAKKRKIGPGYYIVEVRIGDILDWLEKNMKVIYNYEGHLGAEISGDILTKRIYKRKPIEEQSEECIKHVYDLVTNK